MQKERERKILITINDKITDEKLDQIMTEIREGLKEDLGLKNVKVDESIFTIPAPQTSRMF